ncbi:nitroreductase family protein [Mycoplasma sp. P36-A1]|uniref:nitroreductase family protein n=1 Tax=Mycoplasma sp. P36-A1 TaxID=3252900 RepID=UPI003C309D9C
MNNRNENNKVIINGKCIGCQKCVKICVSKALEMHMNKAQVITDNCIKCAQCLAICPVEAITLSGYNIKEIEELDECEYTIDPQKYLNFIKNRRSKRNFKRKLIETEKVEMLIEVGRYSPTAVNMQDVGYIIVEAEKVNELEKLGIKASKLIDDKVNYERGYLFYNAPTVIILTAKRQDNAIIALTNIENMANMLGLGAVEVGRFNRIANNQEIRNYLNIKDENTTIYASIAIGYPEFYFERNALRYEPSVRWL